MRLRLIEGHCGPREVFREHTAIHVIAARDECFGIPGLDQSSEGMCKYLSAMAAGHERSKARAEIAGLPDPKVTARCASQASNANVSGGSRTASPLQTKVQER
jgi:hypothetical protein